MQSEIIFKMAEERFKSVGRFWDSGIVDETEHVRQSPPDMKISLSEFVMRV